MHSAARKRAGLGGGPGARGKVHCTNVFTARALIVRYSTRTTKQHAANIVMSLEQFGFSRGPSKHTVPSATEAALQL